MNTHVAPPPGRLTAEEFLAFIEDRPREERWQLIDGEAFVMMSPARLPHQRIGLNLILHMNDALRKHRPDLVAMHEVAVRVDAFPDFRAIADVAVIGSEVEDEVYGTGFHMAAEVLSESNTRELISRKRTIYGSSPDCQHVLIISQKDFAVEVWSRSSGWKGRVYRSPEDVIELPEFGFACRVADLYRGTPVKG
ncbi:Uma2 family endonuclease [Aquibium microcysteis]|uniref:Uma2 family endonuclease n=1 Tax=Aquibium microcysteis TaxID=675281 RepID=UPI00165D078D|nr:Uma2 family endonuclease [Aquibium microcysteis]